MRIKRFNEAKKVDKKLEVNVAFEFNEEDIKIIKEDILSMVEYTELEEEIMILIQDDDFIEEYIKYSITEQICDGRIVNHTNINNMILDYISSATDETVKEVKSIYDKKYPERVESRKFNF